MNYFELFQIPVSLTPDKNLLSAKYFELQKKYHPDFFTNANDADQSDVLEKSSMVNKAYKTFQNSDATIKYVLELKGLIKDGEKYELDLGFLMEMMELNEGLMDTDDSSMQEAEVKIRQFENSLYEEVRSIIEYYNDELTTEAQLLQVKDYYYKKKYLYRILERLDGMRNIASP
jgi:molecular chaperone HscB